MLKKLIGLYRRLERQAISILPRERRFALLRDKTRIDVAPSAKLLLKVAETREELEECFRLLHDAYVEVGFMKPDPSGLRATIYHALPTTTTLLARYNERIVGTISLIRESPMGFPMQKIFNIEKIHKAGGNIAEVSALAINRRFQASGGTILFPMLKFLYEYSTRFFDTRHLVIAVNPRHIVFYESILFFQRLREVPVAHYDFVNGAPAVGAHLDLRLLPEIMRRYYGTKQPDRNLYRYFCELVLPNIAFPDRRYHTTNDPVMTPELLDYFFNERTEVFASLKNKEKRIFSEIYDLSAYRAVLPAFAEDAPDPGSPASVQRRRQHQRFSVICPATLIMGRRTFSINVIECSLKGFRARSDKALPLEMAGTVKIDLGRAEQCNLSVQVLRRAKSNAGTYVLHIVKADLGWRKFVHALRKAWTHRDLDNATRFLDA